MLSTGTVGTLLPAFPNTRTRVRVRMCARKHLPSRLISRVALVLPVVSAWQLTYLFYDGHMVVNVSIKRTSFSVTVVP